MFVSVITFPIREEKEFEDWVGDNEEWIRRGAGVAAVEFVRGMENPIHVGVVVRFDSRRGLVEFRDSGEYRRMVEDTLGSWTDPIGELRQGHYELLE